MHRILIVEDDVDISSAVKKGLESWGFEAIEADDFKDVYAQFCSCEPQLVLLDVSLPFYNGYYWCTKIRKESQVPIVFISSASDNMNIVMAMNMGGDDFIAKPFDMNVLVAKIQAVIRRAYNLSAVTQLEHRGALLNTADASLSYEGKRVELTKNDYRILQALLESKGKVVSREALMERLWETDSFVDENTLTVNVTRLRKKLDGVGLENFITTKVGLGYIIE